MLIVSAALAAAEETIHIVQRGDTIYSLARTYGVNYQDILNLNGIDDARRIQIGQRIRIPGTSGALSAPQARGVLEHRVTRGETLYGISRLYGLSLPALLSANGLSEKYVLKIGDVLRIPQNGPVMAAPPQGPGLTPILPPAGGDEHYIESPLDISIGTAGGRADPLPAFTASPGIAGETVRSTVSRPVDSSVRWPVAAREIAYLSGKLNGVMLLGERNEPVRSLTTGVVISAGPYRGFGKVAIVQVTGGYWYVYGGCENLTVREGDRVAPGSELGRLGIDALSNKPQLFFLVYRNNVPVDAAAAPRN
jgi:murein DD-endopeptidase MepM/ murein hydrolase activator NlpD